MTDKNTQMKLVTPDRPNSPEEVPAVEEYYPTFRLKLQDIPEAREWRVGSTYMLLVGV